MKHIKLFAVSLVFVLFFSCLKNNSAQARAAAEVSDEIIPVENPVLRELAEVLPQDSYLYILVDKTHALSADYAPSDLVDLENKSYRVNRAGMTLRKEAEAALEEMARAARDEGLTLLASSAYRSYSYQEEVYARHVKNMGQEEADKVSARPGHSQHQLGLVVDFGSITDEFAQTPEGVWLAENASRFGWSLSYPKGYEDVTGYSWECWHYRYVGKRLAAFIDAHFDGIQQYALEFIYKETTK